MSSLKIVMEGLDDSVSAQFLFSRDEMIHSYVPVLKSVPLSFLSLNKTILNNCMCTTNAKVRSKLEIAISMTLIEKP